MLSVGPFSYNRFEAYEKSLYEAAKPDYLDFDKDGDKKEPMKKALKEKGKKPMDEETLEEGMPPWLKDKMDKKSGKKDCDCDHDKKDLQKESNSYQGKVKRATPTGKRTSVELASNQGKVKRATPTGKGIPVELASEGYADAIAKSTAKFGKGALDTAKKSAAAVNKAINTATGRDKMSVKEAVIQSLIDDGLANNLVSAEIMAEHMSDEWFEAIVEELG